MFPIRCFTCNKVLAHLYNDYEAIGKKETNKKAFEILKINRFCCRRMFLSYVKIKPLYNPSVVQ